MYRVLIILLMLFLVSGAALAQDATQEPSAPTLDVEAVYAVATSAAESASKAAESAEAAEQTVNTASRVLDHVDVITGVLPFFIGGVTLILSVIAALFGVYLSRRLRSAEQLASTQEAQLKTVADTLQQVQKEYEVAQQARRKLEDEVYSVLRPVKAQLEEVNNIPKLLQEQSNAAANALRAASLLPLAESQYRALQFKEAIDTYSEAAELNPANPLIQYRLGYVYATCGKLDLAEHCLEKALSIIHDFPPALAALGYLYRQQAEQPQNQHRRDQLYAEAEAKVWKALEKSTKLLDEDGEAWLGTLAGLYRRRGDLKKAIELYEQAAQITPLSSYPWSTLGLLYGLTGQYKKMDETYWTAFRLTSGEISMRSTNYWAHANRVIAGLATFKDMDAGSLRPIIGASMDLVLTIAPKDAPFMLNTFYLTLCRVQQVLINAGTDFEARVTFLKGYLDEVKTYAASEHPGVLDALECVTS